MPLRRRIENGGHTVEDLVINFIGLFDTVASYGVAHYNDTSDLSLDAIRVARKVVHIAAGEEHRKNFRLTNIASAINAGVGIELFFPGVHSDIGGGYTDNYTERELQMLDFDDIETPMMTRRFERERSGSSIRVGITRGEIRCGQLLERAEGHQVGDPQPLHQDPHAAHGRICQPDRARLRFDRRSLPHPGVVGRDQCHDRCPRPESPRRHHIDGRHWMSLRTAEHKTLRHDHLHFSAFYGATMGANDPQWTNDDVWHGTRQRVVQAG